MVSLKREQARVRVITFVFGNYVSILRVAALSIITLTSASSNAQSIDVEQALAGPGTSSQQAPDLTNPFVGKWSYRSFHNNPDLSVSFDKLRFGAGTLELSSSTFGNLSGTIGGPGWSLGIKGWITFGTPMTVRFQGRGEIEDEEWVYDYFGFLAPNWPNGEEQRPAILGTIVRTVPHSSGQSKAGYVASWIAVRQD
jgi:hypothetical protein